MTSVLNLEPETRVNTTTTDFQVDPAIATLSDGSYVVTWSSYTQDGSGYGVYFQHYGADGSHIGYEARANTTTASTQSASAITATDDGGFVIAWAGNGAGDNQGVYFQRYDAHGAPLGGETPANTTTADIQFAPDLSALIGGGFVVTWESEGQDAAGSDGIYSRIYTAAGVAATGEIAVNTTTAPDQFDSKVATLDNGDYVVTWTSFNQDSPSTYGVYARYFTAGGVAAGPEYLVNSTAAADQFSPDIAALADGGYIVAWADSGPGAMQGIFTQRYDASNNPVGGETLAVPPFSAANYFQSAPDVAALSDGGYVVSWTSLGEDGSTYGIYAQRFDDQGNVLGDEVRLNAYTQQDQYEGVIAPLADGGYVAAWASLEDGSNYGVYSRAFEAASSTTGTQYLYGTSGADDLDGGSGNDIMNGGVGDDVYHVNAIGDSVVERTDEGNDTVISAVTWTLGANLENLTLTGSGALSGTGNALNNVIIGNNGVNTLSGGSGDDIIQGGLGNDVLHGGGGSDWLEGGSGNDQIDASDFAYMDGGTGDDVLTAGAYDNTLYGGDGNDLLTGLYGNDTLNGGDGADTLAGGYGLNHLDGGAGDDIILSVGADSVSGGDGHDALAMTARTSSVNVNLSTGYFTDGNFNSGTVSGIEDVFGSNYADVIIGDSGANYIFGGTGDDVIDGGAGDDKLYGDATITTNRDTVSYGTATSAVAVSLALQGDWQDTSGSGSDYLSGFVNLTGSKYNDILSGDSNANVIDGGAGKDTMYGGAGNDTYMVDATTDVASELYGSGYDTVIASVGYALGDGVERLVLTGTVALAGNGNSGNNEVDGNSGDNNLKGLGGNDYLDGGAGADKMLGGAGNDTYVVDNTGDKVYEETVAGVDDGGTDLVMASVTFALGNFIENLTLTGTASNGTGNALGNRITGDDANNGLVGNDGNDMLTGGKGNDKYTGGNGADTFVFAHFGTPNGTDHIVDFATGVDKLSFTAADYGFSPGALPAGELSLTGSAVGASAQFVYNPTTHTLYWDSNGSAAGGTTAIAIFDNAAAPVAGDFVFT